MLSTDKIEAIRQRADIVQVIGSAVVLKKKGQRWVGLCPFHNEKTPSFSVTADKNLYYCFGCHAGGDVFSFVMRHGGIDFQEAARTLATHFGVDIDPESPEDRRRKKILDDLIRVNGYAIAFFEHNLWQNKKESDRHEGRDYLIKRGITESVARTWRLGYGGAPESFVRYLRAKKVPLSLARRMGLIGDDARRGLFDGRLIFPIADERQGIIGFGARRLDDERGPKYVNSRESPLFSKRHTLYGWPMAMAAIRQTTRVVVVEGYMDVLACHRAGISNAVAALGTSMTPEHVRVMGRLAKHVILLFDGDAAGQRAAYGAAQKVMEGGLKALIAPLQAGEDPDSLVQRAGPASLEKTIAEARPAIEHFMDGAFQDGMSVEQRVEAAEALAPLLRSLPSGLEHELYVARLAERVGVEVKQMTIHLQASKGRERHTRAAPADHEQEIQTSPQSQPSNFELSMLCELLLFPQLKDKMAVLFPYTSVAMRVLLESMAAQSSSLDEILSEHITDARWLRRLKSIEPVSDEGTLAQQTFEGVLNGFKKRHLDRLKRQLTKELKQAEQKGQDTQGLMAEIRQLERRRREILNTPLGGET
ncbi:MAG: DNA primase [Myxococcota bacterium]